MNPFDQQNREAVGIVPVSHPVSSIMETAQHKLLANRYFLKYSRAENEPRVVGALGRRTACVTRRTDG